MENQQPDATRPSADQKQLDDSTPTLQKKGSIRLSICIPTYNRGAFIGETLESILSQIRDDIEVVIIDGASTDETEEVVGSFKDQFPHLLYHRGSTNKGVDSDMATSVELANGEYCWLMSSDDLIGPGAISKMMEEISTGDDLYLCDISLCDDKMNPVRNTCFLSPDRKSDRFNLSERNQLIDYLNLATSNNALFCYMCSMAFRKSRWMSAADSSHFFGTGYAHVYKLFSFLKTPPCFIKYIPHSLVLNRPDNDSFSNKGLEKRYLLDFNGYLILANHMFAEDEELRRTFLKVMTREHPWYRLLKLRSEIRSTNRWKELCVKLREFGYSQCQMTLCNILGRFRFLVKGAIYLNEKFPKSLLFQKLKHGNNTRLVD